MKWTLVPIPAALRLSIDLGAIDRQPIEVQPDDVQVPGVRSVRGVRGQLEQVRRCGGAELLRVRRGEPAPRLEQLVRALQLDQPQRGGDVREVVLVPGFLDLVVPGSARGVPLPGIAADAVQAHDPRPGRDRVVVRDQHPALGGRDRLRGIEGVRTRAPEGAGIATGWAADPAGKRVGHVLDHWDPPRVEQARDRLDLDRQAPEVHDDDRLGVGRDGGQDRLGRRVERPRVDVDQHGTRTEIRDDLGAGREGPAWGRSPRRRVPRPAPPGRGAARRCTS